MRHLVEERGRLSGSKTLLSVFTVVAIARYLLDGLAVETDTVKFVVDFEGAAAAAFLTPLAALHYGRRKTEAEHDA